MSERDSFQFKSDVERLQRVALAHGVLLQFWTAVKLWEANSDSACAGWLVMPKDDEELWFEAASFLGDVL